jgi:hypothetical protein
MFCRTPPYAAIAVICVAVFVAAPATALRQEPSSRIVAIGDVHGAFENFVSILQRTGLIDANRRWAGGATTFVQTGDVTDRGEGTRPALDLLMALETEASAAGGRVVALFGNHEGMNLVGEYRDATPEIYATFADKDSPRRRDRAYRDFTDLVRAQQEAAARRVFEEARDRGLEPPKTVPIPSVYTDPGKDAWMAAHPLGFVEYTEAFSPRGKYGQWLRKRPVLAVIGETVFLHGGISPMLEATEDATVRVQREQKAFDDAKQVLIDRKLALPFFNVGEILASARVAAGLTENIDQAALDRAPKELRGVLDIGNSWILSPDGPLWFRGYSTWSDDEGANLIGPILQRYKAQRFVVGHTIPQTRRITPRFSNRVFLIDTGMLSTYFKGGRASALELKDGKITAIYQDQQVEITAP